MGIDSTAVFDITLSDEKFLELACSISEYDISFQEIFTLETFVKNSWELNDFSEDGDKDLEISSCWPFGLFQTGKQPFSLWNLSRWKRITQKERYHYDEFLNSSRLVGKIIGATRVIYLSDYLYEEICEQTPYLTFDNLLQKLQSMNQEEEYWKVFFYEKLE